MADADLTIPATPDGLFIYTHTGVAMDTLITLRVDTRQPAAVAQAALVRAFAWFAAVETACSRFDPRSELARLARTCGEAVAVSPLLLEAVAFALDVARLTRGRFDPTVGAAQQRRGFDREYVSDRAGAVATPPDAARATYRDVRVDRAAGTITLRRPLLLDLGAVAKGLAIDLAARELAAFERYAVDAGGDIYAGCTDSGAAPWQIGVRHPREANALLGALAVANAAVCTSGDYARPAAEAGEHHLLDPRRGRSPRALCSVTVLAPSAIVADALSTAAAILGPRAGLRLLTEQGVSGLLVTGAGQLLTTPGFEEQLR